MLTKLFLHKTTRYFLFLIAVISLSGCLLQPVQENTNLVNETGSTVLAKKKVSVEAIDLYF